MASTQAFRTALHIPTSDPTAGEAVVVTTPGDQYVTDFQSSGGIAEAANDGKTYGRRNEAWAEVIHPAADWAGITGKPATFPPTLPIPTSGVSGLDAQQGAQDTLIAAKADKSYVDSQDAALTGAINLKADKTYVDSQDAAMSVAISGKVDDAISDGKLYGRKDALWAEIPPSAGGVEEAPNDGRLFGRRNLDWEEIPAVVTTAAVEPFEQVFQLGGLDHYDITVPTWAEGVQIDVTAYLTTFTWVLAQVSFDGTTFATGASDYNVVGGVHASGTDAWTSTALTAANGMYLSGSSDGSTAPEFPQNITANINLKRPSAAHLFHMKSYARTYTSSNPARLYRAHWFTSYPAAALSSALAIKAIRLFPNVGHTFANGSWVRFRWIGNIPVSVGLPEAPLDGQAYERKAGAWSVATGGGGGGVTSVTGTAPVVSSGGSTPAISMPAATGSVAGHLTAADWTTFNNKASVSYVDAADMTLQGQIALKANLASPAFTGSPTAPTVSGGDNSTAIATTAWVKSQGYGAGGGGIADAPNDGKPYVRKSLGWDDFTDDMAAKLSLTGGTMTGKLNLPPSIAGSAYLNLGAGVTVTTGLSDGDVWISGTGNSLQWRMGGTTYTAMNLGSGQTVSGVKTFTSKTVFSVPVTTAASILLQHGSAPTTPINGDVWTTTAGMFVQINGTTLDLASKAYVTGLGYATTSYVDSGLSGKANTAHTHAQADVTNLVSDLAAKAPLASPGLTGTPTAPTATAGTNTTQIASTAFVTAAVAAKTSTISVSDTPPGTPVDGQLWWESDTGRLFIRFNDGSSTAWVQAAASATVPKITVSATAPASPSLNDLWVDIS